MRKLPKLMFYRNLCPNILMLGAILLSAASAFPQHAAVELTKANEVVSHTGKTDPDIVQTDVGLENTIPETVVKKTEFSINDALSLVSGKTRSGESSARFRTNYFSPPPKAADPKLEKPAQGTAASDSHFAFAPYLFMAGIRGTIGARNRSIEIDGSFGTVLKNLDLGFMGTFTARKGKVLFINEIIWTKMSVERDTPFGLFGAAKLGVNLFILDPEVGYRFIDNERGVLDVLAGVRIWSVENNLNVTSGILPGFDVSERKSWATPVVGLHGILNLTSKFYLATKVDVGGGIGADSTYQFFGGAGYRIKPKIALIGGYRLLQVDYDDSQGFLFDTTMSGLLFGAKFNF